MKKYSLYEVFKDNGLFVNEAVDFYSDKNKTISVYHLTGKRSTMPRDIDGVVKKFVGDIGSPGNEFQPGSGDMYGKGLYTCYKLNKEIVHTYGNTLLEFKVPVKNFLVFVDDEAQAIHGDNASLDKQLFSILDRKGIDYTSNQDFNFIINQYAEELKNIYESQIKGTSTEGKNRTAPICINSLLTFSSLTRNKIKLKHLIDGVIFYGQADGPVCVIFNTQIAAINRVGKVIGKEVEIFERPSQIGIDDFDNKTFNQIRRAYSAKRGKGQKEWRAHQKKLIDVVNNEISDYKPENVFNKSLLKTLANSLQLSLLEKEVLPLFKTKVVSFEASKIKDNYSLTQEQKNNLVPVFIKYVKSSLQKLKFDSMIDLCFKFSREFDELCKLSNINYGDKKFNSIFNIFEKYSFGSSSMDEMELDEAMYPFDIDVEQFDKITETLNQIKEANRHLLDIVQSDEMDDEGPQSLLTDNDIKVLKETFEFFNDYKKGVEDLSEIEVYRINTKIADIFNKLIKIFKENFNNILPAELLKVVEENYELINTELSPEEVVEKIFESQRNYMERATEFKFEEIAPTDLGFINGLKEPNYSFNSLSLVEFDFLGFIFYRFSPQQMKQSIAKRTSYGKGMSLFYLKQEESSQSIFQYFVNDVTANLIEDREEYYQSIIMLLRTDILEGDLTFAEYCEKAKYVDRFMNFKPVTTFNYNNFLRDNFKADIK